MIRYLLITSCLFFISHLGKAQVSSDPNTRIIPGVCLGYTFGKGINFGLDLGVSFFDYQVNKMSGYSGINFSYAIFTHRRELYKNGYYRVFAINLMNVVDDKFILKAGMAKTKLKWGVNNVNKSYSNGWGLNMAIAFKPFIYSPSVGFRFFKINNVCMGIGATNPKFLYVGYELPYNLVDQSVDSPQ